MAMVSNKARMHPRSKSGAGSGTKARRRGLAAVEFALVAVPLFLLLIGLIDYGWIFLKVQQVTQAARAGARAAVVPEATPASVETTINQWMDWAGIESFDYTLTSTVVSEDPKVVAMKVEITVPTDQLLELIRTSLIPVPPNLKAAASMAKEGP